MIEQLDGLRHGFFVDVGAYDGIEHSNTYALEKAYRWHGLCIEPNTDAFIRLERNRSCDLSRFAATDSTGVIRFMQDRVLERCDRRGVQKLGCTLNAMLENCGAPDDIDYLSIDVEGHELHVLRGIDFDRWHVKLITIEHNLYLTGPEHKMNILRYLREHGFERVVENVEAPGYGPYEDWYRCMNSALRDS